MLSRSTGMGLVVMDVLCLLRRCLVKEEVEAAEGVVVMYVGGVSAWD